MQGAGNYFAGPKPGLKFIHTGCKILDCALGGGWARNRIFNVIGDRSTGKTLLCIEAAANFAKTEPKGRIVYREVEAAFDVSYAAALGMPVKRVEFNKRPMLTVEEVFNDLVQVVEESSAANPTLYILDSLDALSDKAEMERDIDKGSYGASKAAQMSELFRRSTQKLQKHHVTFGIVSQMRDKIGVSFGRKWSRSGGRALDFYASQVLVLSQLNMVQKTVRGIRRPVAINVRAKVDKNKVSLPFREAEFQLTFGYGVEDTLASLMWLRSVKALDQFNDLKNNLSDKELKRIALDVDDDAAEKSRLEKIVETHWWEIETKFLPTRKKY